MGRKLTSITCALLLILGFLTDAAHAVPSQSIPLTMNFQGQLSDLMMSAAVTSSVAMRFGIYANGTRIWYAEYSSVTVTSGSFAVLLGSTEQGGTPLNPTTGGGGQPATALPLRASHFSAFDSTAAIELELEIFDGVSFDLLSPRFRLASAIFALKADSIDGYDSSELAKQDASGNIVSSSGGVPVISPTGAWIGPAILGASGGTGVSGMTGATGTTGPSCFGSTCAGNTTYSGSAAFSSAVTLSGTGGNVPFSCVRRNGGATASCNGDEIAVGCGGDCVGGISPYIQSLIPAIGPGGSCALTCAGTATATAYAICCKQ